MKKTVFTNCGTLISESYVRVVRGERGDYIEIDPKLLIWKNTHIPETEKKRIGNLIYYYDEYRTNDKCNVKIYHQKKKVDYADYVIGMIYISLNDVNLKIKNLTNFIN